MSPPLIAQAHKPCLMPMLFAIVWTLAPASNAQLTSDPFEGGEPRWRLVESDCEAQLTQQEISLIFPHSGRTSELLELACSSGTLALLAYPIEPCTIIDEFRPRTWVRCSSRQLRLGARVIFPFAAHPTTGGRLTTILWGSSYETAGEWQALEIDEIMERLQEEVVAIRQRFGSEIQLKGAYIDSLVLNAYTGPGRYRFQVDDLELRGMITMAAVGNPPPANWKSTWRWRHNPPSPELRYWSRPNVAPIWIQHRGEDLTWLNSLGFTGLVMDQVPTPESLKSAQALQMGVISPPPSFAIEFPSEVQSSLRGWMVGSALDKNQQRFVQDQAQRVAALPKELQRPLVAEALEDFFQYSRVADEVIIPQPIASAAGLQRDKIAWLSHHLDLTKQRSDGWVSINYGVPPSILTQLMAAKQIVEPESDEEHLAVDPSGFRQQVINAILAGARGILVRTFHPLDIKNSADSAQVAALRLVQHELRLWGPWIVGGQSVPPPNLSNPTWLAKAWNIDDNLLIVAKSSPPGSQFTQAPTMREPVDFQVSMIQNGQSVFRLTAGRLERMPVERNALGTQWRVERPASVESFLITSSPVVINFARRHFANHLDRIAADQLEVVTFESSLAARLLDARFAFEETPSPMALQQTRLLANAQRIIDSSIQAMRTRQTNAAINLNLEAQDVVQQVLFESYQNARAGLASPQSTPLLVTPAALSLHWRIAQACDRSEWRTAVLPGGGFTDLADMLRAGWTQQRRLEEQAELRVELVPTQQTGAGGLRLASYSRNAERPLESGFAGASLRVRSAGIDVRAGQLLRVSGTALVLNQSTAPDSGLLVYDNQIGPSLGQLVRGDSAQQVPVELYRFVVNDGEFRILAECRGESDIVLENVQVDVIEPATNRQSFATNPLDLLRLEIAPLETPPAASGTLRSP